MRTTRQHVGSWGEELVRAHYARHGFSLLVKNVRLRRSEIDLLFVKRGVLYSVEVKTRRSLSFGNPEDSITTAKRERLFRATAQYAATQRRKFAGIVVQIAAVSVSRDRILLRIFTVD